MIDRKILGYFSMVFILVLCAALFKSEQPILAGIIGLVYLVFVFGIDKFKIDFKNKKIELEDKDESKD